ncbi:hypothetical protein AXG93_1543s1390 [Marchantia polymorpha subsp. ruderalis]|uniref:Uncharacterized protein n=1 Tax=Marchantia polymorpha subsp. ruderalis TaxID=1480154 RepID=A0A176VZ41_MARPO|nr:hypothetical protein AXG93_1543s1390 [Marchantia polymorpha subsp. ruderalis]
MQKASGARSLVHLCSTRWSTIKQTCKTLLTSDKHMHAIVSSRNFMKGTVAQVKECIKVKKIITNLKFFDLLKKTIEILAPIDILIVKYQSEKIFISKMMPNFHALPLEFLKLLTANIINEDELAYLIKTCVSRLMFMYGNTHAQAQIIFKQYTRFVIAATKAKEEESMRYIMVFKGHKTVLQYWLVDDKYWPRVAKCGHQALQHGGVQCRLIAKLVENGLHSFEGEELPDPE